MSSPVERLLAMLPNAKRAGSGWMARCPAHDDRKPSLSIAQGDDGRALVNCHAGCTVDAICGALGITKSDLFPERERPRKRPQASASKSPKTYATAKSAVTALGRSLGKRSASWTYHNVEGEPIGVVLRWDGEEGKEIRPVSRTEGGWVVKAMPAPRPLYGLHELAKADRVFITEGEKAADAARSLGFIATTSAGGSKAPQKTDWAPLAGKECVILPDNDDAGRRYVEEVAAILAKLTPPPKAKVIELPELPAGGDVVEFIAARSGDVETIRAEIEAMVTTAEAATPDHPTPAVEPFEPFPVDALPEPFRRFVTNGAKALGCEPSYIALPLLAAAASAIGNTRRVQLKRGWSEPAIVWAGIVGDSGTLKSPALELALQPTRDRQRKAMRENAEAMDAFRVELMHHDREISAWKKSKSDDDPPEPPEQPIVDRCWTDDATTEALAVLLVNQWRGLLMVRDELAGWIGGFDRYAAGKGGDAAKWLEMFGGRPMIVDRKTSGTIYVPAAAVSIAGGIQPETLRRALGTEHRENGLAARLLLSWPPRRPKRWTEVDIDPMDQATIALLFDRLYELEPAQDKDGDPCPEYVPLTREGKAAWIEFYNAHAEEQADLAGDLSAAWSKLEGYAARLALVVHFVRWAADDPELQSPDAVDEVSIAAGVELSRWFGHEARRVYGMLAESGEERDRRRLVEWIERRGGTVTVRDLTHGMRQYRNAGDAARLALDMLATVGLGSWTRPAPGPKGGRPSARFKLATDDGSESVVREGFDSVPGVTVTEIPAESNANAGNGDGDTGDDWGEL